MVVSFEPTRMRFAIVRIDHYVADEMERITVHAILPTLEEAKREVIDSTPLNRRLTGSTPGARHGSIRSGARPVWSRTNDNLPSLKLKKVVP
jgi:hypothetical protein